MYITSLTRFATDDGGKREGTERGEGGMGLRVEMEGRKEGRKEGRQEGRITSPGGQTRTTLTYPDKSVTIATLKRPTGTKRVEPEKERCMYYIEDVVRSSYRTLLYIS